MYPVGRRDVLRLGVLAAAGFATPLRALRSPVFGSVYREPGPALIEVDLTAAVGPTSVAGTRATLWTYNGSFPGPLLRWREGDRVRVRLTNLLAEPTNLHIHGLHIPPDQDNPFRSVEPGDSAVCEFTVPAGSAGTYWYHPHLHERVARQLFAGMAGAIVVEGPVDELRGLRDADEYVLVLKDLTLADGAVAAHTRFDWATGKEGDLQLVNGTIEPVLTPERSLLRLRLLNASNARYYRLTLEGHRLYMIATDGGFLERAIPLPELLLAPGERAEVLVRLQRNGLFRLRNLPYDRGAHGMGHMGPGPHHQPWGGSQAPDDGETLVTIDTSAVSRYVRMRSIYRRIERLAPEPNAPVRRLVLSESMMGGGFFINGLRFDAGRTDIRGQLGSAEVWEIENRGGMDHPFHLHTYPFQVLSRDGVPEPFTAWKDVVNVRRGERLRIAVPLRDFRGKTVFHCHIVEHEDLGMMGVLAT